MVAMTQDPFRLTDREFREFGGQSVAIVEALFAAGEYSEWLPQVAILAQDARGKRNIEIVSICGPFTADAEKRPVMSSLGRKAYADKILPIAMTLVSEAWFSRQPPGSARMRPENDPNRTTVLVCMACAWDGRTLIAHAETTTDGRGIRPTGPFSGFAAGGQTPLLTWFFEGFRQAVLEGNEARAKRKSATKN